MTRAQKLAVRLSEIRTRLNELSGEAEPTDEQRAEMDALASEYGTTETRWRAATIAESEAAQEETREETGDGEGAELRSLRGSVRLGRYVTAAATDQRLDGAEAEFNAAVEVPNGMAGTTVPWALFEPPTEPPVEQRAATTTANYAGGVMQRPVLQRLFAPGIMDTLGVRIDSVPAGRSEWPLITAGVAPDMKAEGDAAPDAVAATFATETLKPKRLTGRYEWTHEMDAQVLDLEPALRRDLADAVKSRMNDLILTGNEATNAHEPDGFLTTLAPPGTPPPSEATFDDYAGSAAQAVDGLHASMEGEVSALLGVDTYKHAASVFQAGSGEAGVEALKRRCRACMASAYVPAVSSNLQAAIYHAGGPGGGEMRGDSVAAIWPSIELIRDPYSNASTGTIITWVQLWDAQTAFRQGAYLRRTFRLA